MGTSQDYRRRLNSMKPNLYVGGEKVGRDDPRIQPGTNVLSVSYDLAQDPEWEDLLTVPSPWGAGRVSRFAHLPRNPYDLMQKQKMVRLLCHRVGGCIQRCMGMDALIGLSIVTKEMDEKHGTSYHARFSDYLRHYQEEDLVGTCAQTDVKGDRKKRPADQADPDAYVHVVEVREDGIIVKGAKHCITMAAYADELIVIPTRAMGEADRDYAVAFALPADWEGVYLITRPVAVRQRTHTDCPLAQMGVSDSMIVFDNVFVPMDRVFMCGEWDFSRRLALLFADSHRHSYSGCKPAVSDILCGAAALAAEANNVEQAPHVREKLSQFAGAAELAFAAGVAAAVFGERTSSGTFFPNPVYANVGRRLTGETIYHEYNLLVEIAGGLPATLPFEGDFYAEETKDWLAKYIVRNPAISAEASHRTWRLVENLTASSMASWYQIAGVHGGGSPIMETIALNSIYDYEARKNLARYLAGIDPELDQSRLLGTEPTGLFEDSTE